MTHREYDDNYHHDLMARARSAERKQVTMEPDEYVRWLEFSKLWFEDKNTRDATRVGNIIKNWGEQAKRLQQLCNEYDLGYAGGNTFDIAIEELERRLKQAPRSEWPVVRAQLVDLNWKLDKLLDMFEDDEAQMTAPQMTEAGREMLNAILDESARLKEQQNACEYCAGSGWVFRGGFRVECPDCENGAMTILDEEGT